MPRNSKLRPVTRIVASAFLSLPVLALGSMSGLAYVEHSRELAANRRAAEINCLAENVYYEARGELLAGQYAVAEVTMNRVSSPFFPASVCDVVHEARWTRDGRQLVGQFSWTVEDSMPVPEGIAWQRALSVASTIYDNREAPLVDGALFYHATYVAPNWARVKNPVVRIGGHLFYY